LKPRMQVAQTQSNLLKQPNDAVKEISVEDFTRIMKTQFAIYSEPVPGKPYFVRYTGPPYDQRNEDCRSMQVPTHAKGTKFCPLVIFSVLDKFEIPLASYLEAVSGQGKLLPIKPSIKLHSE
jgi:hypothetical protein